MLTLKKDRDRRVRGGHLWVFSNEIADPPVASLEPGSIHEMYDHRGQFLAMVYVNPASLIAARILSTRKEAATEALVQARIEDAVHRRSSQAPDRNSIRLVFGEADLLPGLIVDRFEDYLVVQTLTAGMDRMAPAIIGILDNLIGPAGMFVRNDAASRLLENLPQEKYLARGTVPERITIRSGNLPMIVDIPNGQKTGFFLDQELNRMALRPYVPQSARVLDLFAYSGAWGLQAAAAGAAEVVTVDSSAAALDLARESVELNGFADRFQLVRDKALDFLKKSTQTWDVVILDPPAFIQSKSHLQEGRKGYIDLNRRALSRTTSGSLLVTCSCSHHLDLNGFLDILAAASRQSGRNLRVLEVRGQSPDHPILLAMPETRYLKVVFAEIM